MEIEKKADMYHAPAVEPPSVADVKKLSDDLGFGCSVDDLEDYRDVICEFLKSYDTIEQLPEPTLPVKYPRTPGYKPEAKDNIYNAWQWRCDIKGAAEGKLAGLKVGIKDNISVAGVPMSNGSKLLSGFVPAIDATVVTRILDEGGHIIGKTACEDFCKSGNSFTNAYGPVLNPHDRTRSCGGSSGGSCVLVSTGDVDVALACDQGGSIRIPAAWCGIVGIKPTFGLVPYTGICSLDGSIDHVGPVARTVQECALLLEVVAGYDNGLDPRQHPGRPVPQYSKLLTGNVEGMKIGIMKEGFEDCESKVQDIVRSAANQLASVGATVETVSFPQHKQAKDIWASMCMDGTYNTLMKAQGAGMGYRGFYPTDFSGFLSSRLAAEPHLLSEQMKLVLMMGHYVDQKHHGRFYAKAQNINRTLISKMDELFEKYDALIMPTLPYVAPVLPSTSDSLKERMDKAFGMVKITAPYNATGHPALTVNAASSGSLPIGMMLVGGYYQEAKLFNIARAYEKIRDGH